MFPNYYRFCLFHLILYFPSTIFQLQRDGSSWAEPVLSQDYCSCSRTHCSDVGEALTCGPLVSSQALYHCTPNYDRLFGPNCKIIFFICKWLLTPKLSCLSQHAEKKMAVKTHCRWDFNSFITDFNLFFKEVLFIWTYDVNKHFFHNCKYFLWCRASVCSKIFQGLKDCIKHLTYPLFLCEKKCPHAAITTILLDTYLSHTWGWCYHEH